MIVSKLLCRLVASLVSGSQQDRRQMGFRPKRRGQWPKLFRNGTLHQIASADARIGN